MQKASSAILFLMVAAVPVFSQWLQYPTPGVPKTPDGKPNLSAPAPRTTDGKPDLTGIWELDHTPCPPAGCDDYVAGPEFLNIGAKLPGGLPYQPWAAELVKKRTEQQGVEDPVARCLPAGAVRLLTFPPPRKILQLPGEIVILSERDVTFQQIFTDGRPLPADPAPNWNGYSVGKWDGDALVVQTIGLRNSTWLDRNGSPLTESAKLTERFRRVNYGTLDIELTVDDSGAYTKPWTVTLRQKIVLNTELLDYFCTDNEKDAQHVFTK